MKLSVFEEIKLRLKILEVNTLFSFRESLAYSLNNWGGLASTITYMVSYLVFVSAIYGRVSSIAGYTYSQVLLFTFVAQMNFYLTWVWNIINIEKLGQDIKSGKLDLILSKPLPALWYVTFQKVNLSMLVFEMWPATIPLLYLLFKNADFTFTLTGVIFSVLTFILGQIGIHCFAFIISLLAFWTGESKGLVGLSYQISFFGDAIPLEAYPNSVKILGLTAVPFLVHTALATSYLLNKTTNPLWLLLVLITSAALILIKVKAWNFALRHYTSASS